MKKIFTFLAAILMSANLFADNDVIWSNDGSNGAVSWSGTYRFALEGNDGLNECIAQFSQEVWDKLKTSTFYLVVEGANPQVRVCNGWWDPVWKVGDIQPGNSLMTDNGDGTFTIEINISDDTALVESLDQKHLLFTGDRYTPKEIYFKGSAGIHAPSVASTAVENVRYNLSGQKVNASYQGVVIINGKKYIQK